MDQLKENLRPVVRELAREMSAEEIDAVAGGVKCQATAGASGTANWDGSVDDSVEF